jgi:hypothetical protein
MALDIDSKRDLFHKTYEITKEAASAGGYSGGALSVIIEEVYGALKSLAEKEDI